MEAGFDWVVEAGQYHMLDAGVEAEGGEVVAKDSPRLATIASYRMPGVSASSQLIGFDLAGISGLGRQCLFVWHIEGQPRPRRDGVE